MKTSDIYSGSITSSFTLGMLLMNLKYNPQTKNFLVYSYSRKQKKVLDRPITSMEKNQFHQVLQNLTGLTFARTSRQKSLLPLIDRPRSQLIACIKNDGKTPNSNTKVTERDLQEQLISQIENNIGTIIVSEFLQGAFSLRGTLDKERGNATSFQNKCKTLCDFFYCTNNHRRRKYDIIRQMINGNSSTMDINDGVARHPRTAQFRIYARLFKQHSSLLFQYKQDCLDEVCK